MSVSSVTVHVMPSAVPCTWQALSVWINGVITSDIDARHMRSEKSTELSVNRRVRILTEPCVTPAPNHLATEMYLSVAAPGRFASL